MEAKHHKQKADATDGWVNGRRNGTYNHPTTRGKRKRKLTLRVLIASPNQCAAFAPSHWFRSHNAFTHTFSAEQIMAVKSFSKDIRKNTSQQGSFFFLAMAKQKACSCAGAHTHQQLELLSSPTCYHMRISHEKKTKKTANN